MPELHQLDIQGDPSGFYESGIAPLSLHHFKGGIWHSAKPYEGAKIVHACGEDCFLQRFLTRDDFIISNGYSVAHYPRGIQFDANQIERTFHAAPDDYGWNLDFMLGGPGRRSLVGTGRKVAWELKESVIQEDGSVRQSYIRRADDERWTENGKPLFELDGILELIWIPWTGLLLPLDARLFLADIRTRGMYVFQRFVFGLGKQKALKWAVLDMHERLASGSGVRSVLLYEYDIHELERKLSWKTQRHLTKIKNKYTYHQLNSVTVPIIGQFSRLTDQWLVPTLWGNQSQCLKGNPPQLKIGPYH
jgi:hypothetical protein